MRLLGSVVVAVAVLVSGCAAGPDKGSTLESQFAELMARPDIEAAAQRYEEMRTQVRERLVGKKFVATWQERVDTVGGGSCARTHPEVPGGEAEFRILKLWSAPGNVSDDKWESAVSAVMEVAREYGFGQPQIVVNRQGEHEVSIKDGYGAEVLFGTAKNTILTVTTGCHLTVAAHQRGTPAPKPGY